MSQSREHIFFITRHFWQALGIEHLENTHIVCLYWHSLIPLMRDRGVSVFCLQEADARMQARTTVDALEDKKVQAFIKSKAGTPCILVYKPVPRIHRLCAELGYSLLANGSDFLKQYEDKIDFYDASHDELNFPQSVTGILSDFSYDSMSDLVSPHVVVQTRRGFSGNSTYFIRNKDEYEKTLAAIGSHKVRISELIAGRSITVNACNFYNKVLVSKPMLQITGDTRMTPYEGGTCGVQLLEDTVEWYEDVHTQIQTLGKKLLADGYQGIWGADFVVSPRNDVYLIECNPRLIASLPFYTKKQVASLKASFLEHHIQSFVPFFQRHVKTMSLTMPRSGGTALTFRNLKPHDVSVFPSAVSGVYVEQSGFWHYMRPEYDVNRLEDGEALVLFQESGRVESGRDIGVVWTHDSLTDGFRLSSQFDQLYEATYQKYFA